VIVHHEVREWCADVPSHGKIDGLGILLAARSRERALGFEQLRS
jgi:hypothetical protein